MVDHLNFPTQEKKVFQEMINQVLVVINDSTIQKELMNRRITAGITALSSAYRHTRTDFKLKALNTGIQDVTTGLADAHAFIKYRGEETLAELYQAKVDIYQRRGVFGWIPKIIAQSKAAYHQKQGLHQRENSWFAAGFLENLVDFQPQQFTASQLKALKEALNFVALDVRPLTQVFKVELGVGKEIRDAERLETFRSTLATKINSLNALQAELKKMGDPSWGENILGYSKERVELNKKIAAQQLPRIEEEEGRLWFWLKGSDGQLVVAKDHRGERKVYMASANYPHDDYRLYPFQEHVYKYVPELQRRYEGTLQANSELIGDDDLRYQMIQAVEKVILEDIDRRATPLPTSAPYRFVYQNRQDKSTNYQAEHLVREVLIKSGLAFEPYPNV